MNVYFENHLWLNDGQGQFSQSATTLCPTATYTAFADLNGDGYTDAVCGNTVFFNDGRGHFDRTAQLPSTIDIVRPVLLDVNGDGATDIIVTSASADRLLLNDGRGGFTDTGRGFGGWGQASYAAADINGDGVTDVLVAIPHTPPPAMAAGSVKIWLGDGHGAFTEMANGLPASRGAVLRDFNGDGAADLFLGLEVGGGRLYLNDGHGQFADSGQSFGSDNVSAVQAADFNGDGYLDLFLASGAPTDRGTPNTVWLNEGTGRFTDSGLRPGNSNSLAVALGDLNGDGKTDAFVGNVVLGGGAATNEIWLNTGASASELRAGGSGPAGQPILTGAGVVNAASYALRMAPDSFLSVFGENLAADTLSWANAIPDGLTLPRVLGGLRVSLDGRDCFPSYASPRQANAIAPAGVPPGRRTLTVANGQGAASIDVLVEPTAPGFFTFTQGGVTYPDALIANKLVYVAQTGAFPGVECRPAHPSEYISLYANGLGATAPHPAGQILHDIYTLLDAASVTVTVGGQPARVSWAGLTYAGLFQVNVQLPADLPDGDLPIMIEAGGQSSPANVFLPVEAAPYTITDLGTLGGMTSYATGINASGQVVGSATTGAGEDHPFVYGGGSMTDLGTLGGTIANAATAINAGGQIVGVSPVTPGTDFPHDAFLYANGRMTDIGSLGGGVAGAFGINASGDIVGSSDVRGGATHHAFRYHNGTMIDLGTLGGAVSDAVGINDSGQIAGGADTAGGGPYHPFLYGGGTMADVGTLGGTTGHANAINNGGQLAGVSQLAGNAAEHAFLYGNGVMTDLGTLGGATSSASAINGNGDVVGASATASAGQHAFLYRNGTMIDLNTRIPAGSGWTLTGASGINDQGQVVGTGIVNGHAHAYLLTR
jgi:uncharacterized protein (TIGR03437 family)